MERLQFIFNPDHDTAMANFTPYYKCSAEISRMAADLCILPVWYIPEDVISYVIVDSQESVDLFSVQLSSFSHFDPSMFLVSPLNISVSPWGWNPSIVHNLSEQGVSESLLPDIHDLKKLRYFSSRGRCVDVLSSMLGIDGVCGKTVECSSMEQVEKLLFSFGKVVLKAPWSGSGRGLYMVSYNDWNANVAGWVSRVIRTQGSVMVEPHYNKVCDFAMEFFSSSDGGVEFVGYSLFETDTHGNYKRNLLLSNDAIKTRLLEYISEPVLTCICDRLLKIFNDMFSRYFSGYFGVDMMVCCENGKMLVHPCVEINLRMNMGVVARLFFDRFVASSSHGVFTVEHYNSDGEAMAFHSAANMSYPLRKDIDGRILSGYLSLTPVKYVTRYQIYVILREG